MSGIAVFVIRHPEYDNQDLINYASRMWRSVGFEFQVCDSKSLDSTQNVIKEYDDVIVYCDDFIGPINDMNDFTKRIKNSEKSWKLTNDSMFFGIKKHELEKVEFKDLFSDSNLLDRQSNEVLDSWAELYDTKVLQALTDVPMLDKPYSLVKMGCPFLKHLIFHRNYDDVISTTLGHQARVVYDYLHEVNSELTGYLWHFLLSTFNQEDLYRNLHLSYILSSKNSNKENASKYLEKNNLLLVMHLYYPDKFIESMTYASYFPRNITVCITTSSEEKAVQLESLFQPLGFKKLFVRVIENRGRDVSALLVGAADLVPDNDIVCFFHDKKTLQTKPGSVGLGFSDKLIENMFGTSDYILNIINLFADNENLGLISPPPPHHGDYYFTQGRDWGPNYVLTVNLADKLRLNVPISDRKSPIAPLGTCFWFRQKAMKPLMDVKWEYNDFPPEPNGIDGTLLHAIERIYPFVVCDAGYYPAYVMTDRWAKVEYTSLRYYVEGYNKVCLRHGILNDHRNMREEIRRRLKY